MQKLHNPDLEIGKGTIRKLERMQVYKVTEII